MRLLALPSPRSLALCLFLLVACGHQPPYGRADRPSPAALLATTTARLPALAVSDADVTINRIARADLAMLAQAPNRFRGSVTKAGNELVELSFHEQGYGLRYKLDQLPTGFYHGPPDRCAVEAMLGVPLSYEGLVALVLGGAPLLEEPRQILDQRWDRRDGVEKLVIANADFVEELRFTRQDGAWRFTGATMWQRTPGGDEGNQLWSLQHDKFGPVGSAVLPGRTRIKAPGKKRDSLVVINYSGRDPNPPWASSAGAGAGDTGDSGAGQDDGGWTDDSGGWEGGEDEATDDGWEDGSAPAEPAEPEPDPSEAAPAEPARAVVSASAPPPDDRPPAVTHAVPMVFIINGNGLPDRGDLCH